MHLMQRPENAITVDTNTTMYYSKNKTESLDQGCHTHGFLGAILHVGSRAEGRMMFFDLEITTSPGNDLCNVAPSEVDLRKKEKLLTSPASPHHRSS